MLNIFLFIQLVVAILLIFVVLLQRTGADGVSGLSSGNNMGVVSARAKANFLTRTTMVLAFIFMANSLFLANLSSKKSSDLTNKINKETQIENDNEGLNEITPEERINSEKSDSLPIAN